MDEEERERLLRERPWEGEDVPEAWRDPQVWLGREEPRQPWWHYVYLVGIVVLALVLAYFVAEARELLELVLAVGLAFALLLAAGLLLNFLAEQTLPSWRGAAYRRQQRRLEREQDESTE